MKIIIWNKINWTEIELIVYNLQRKIFLSSVNCNSLEKKIKIRQLQESLIKTEEAKLLAIRKVTQDNRGKSTAGVDGIKCLLPDQRIDLLSKLQLDGKTDLIKRIFIPQINGKIRPLGIPTIRDKVKQTLVLLALEPEWESRFEINSYGYRPCYSVADVKWIITRQIQGGPKYVLDGDISGCFDNINHEYLIKKLDQTKMISNQINNWLKAGILQKNDNECPEENLNGTPQGSPLSPLLSNIALHGVENFVKDRLNNKVKLIRYSDNFLVFGNKLNEIIESKKLIQEFLQPIGLKLSEEKTQIIHTMDKLENKQPGFNFLGFHFVNLKSSINRGVKNTKGIKQPFIQKCVPSKESIFRHKNNLKKLLEKHKNSPLKAIIGKLSAKIQGWTNYFSISQSTKTFSQLDGWLWKRLWRWSVKRYKNANNAKIACWSVNGWKFGFKQKDQTFILKRHDQTKVKNHIKIKPGASIYNGELEYFAKRVSLTNSRIMRMNGLFKKQNYKCTKCNNFFKPTDIIEIHHTLTEQKLKTGKIEFVHGFCHDKIHS